MNNPQVTDFNPDIISDLKEELIDKRQSSNDHLLKLEQNPEHSDLINLLFRDVHTVKGDLGIMGISQYLPLLQSIEDVMDNLRKGQKLLCPALGDVLLLSLDVAFNELEQFLNQEDEFDSEQYNKLADMLSTLAHLEGKDADKQTLAIVQALAPETVPSNSDVIRHPKDDFT